MKIGTMIVAGIIGIFVLINLFNRYQEYQTDQENSQLTAEKSEVLKLLEKDQVRGDRDAPNTIIVYSDFQCPYCVKFHKTMLEVMDVYPKKVKWIYRHFPLSSHQFSNQAAIATEAAALQNKFWEFSDKMMENSKADGAGIREEDILRYAVDLGLDIDRFKTDLESKETSSKVEADIASALELGVSGTPQSYLIDKNGKIKALNGALTFQLMKIDIDGTPR